MIPERPTEIAYKDYVMSHYRSRRVWPHEYFINTDTGTVTDKEIRKWCKESLAGSHHVISHKVNTPVMGNLKVIAAVVRIQDVEDAVLFKLRWFNHLA